MKVSVTQYSKTVTIEDANDDASAEEAVEMTRDMLVSIGYDHQRVDQAMRGARGCGMCNSLRTDLEQCRTQLQDSLDRENAMRIERDGLLKKHAVCIESAWANAGMR